MQISQVSSELDQYLTYSDIADILSVSINTVKKFIKEDGLLRVYIKKGMPRIRKVDFETWINEREEE